MSSNPSPPQSRDPDVAIVGAGAAGIAAARCLRECGLRPLVLEAGGRAGGRALTSSAGIGVPIDRGCAWFHDALRNPLRQQADRLGFRYDGNTRMRFHVGGHLLEGAAAEAIAAGWRRAEATLRTVGGRGADVSAAELLDPHAPHAPIRDYLLTAINGVPPQRYATAEAGAEDAVQEDWLALDGLGCLLEHLGRGADIALGCAVRRVHDHRDGVRLETDGGSVRAAAAIVTVSTGVLGSGAIAFDPPLPGERRDALAAVPMGRAEKLALRFRHDPIGLPANTYVVIQRDGEVMGFHLLPGEALTAVGYAGGDAAAAIARGREEPTVEWALGFLEHAFGTDVRRYRSAATRTRWLQDPLFRGSYSAAVPRGGHAARRVLARPLTERVHFAGEATDPVAFATVHGAWTSGERAARQIAAMLGRGRHAVIGRAGSD